MPAALVYYESMGQNWERAALIKAQEVEAELMSDPTLMRLGKVTAADRMSKLLVEKERVNPIATTAIGKRLRARTLLAGAGLLGGL